jgi:hypothetical protein
VLKPSEYLLSFDLFSNTTQLNKLLNHFQAYYKAWRVAGQMNFNRILVQPKEKILLLLFIPLYFTSHAQVKPVPFNAEVNQKVAIDSTAKIFVSEIRISGNKKTKAYIIQREMRMKLGDSILASTLLEKLKLSQQLIYNTTLFASVVLEPRFITATDLVVEVTVKEKWYIYPAPQVPTCRQKSE